MSRLLALLAILLADLSVILASTSIDSSDPAIKVLVGNGDYDRELCATAQRVILNAGPADYRTQTLVAAGGTFVTEQMDTDLLSNTVTVAALLETVQIDRSELAVDIACKLVNQDRVNDVLNLELPLPAGTCRDVNQLTYQIALEELDTPARQRYLSEGTPLQFEADYEAAAGGEWLPSVVSDYIRPVSDATRLRYISIQAPSVQVPWPDSGGAWYQGTHHCKLITLAAMTNWMTSGSLDGATELFPRPRPKCVEPDSRTSAAGSCLLYFGPAGAQFCQDYSGSGWTEVSAREDCNIRHPNLAAWTQGSDKYNGGGGIFSAASCADREVVAESRREPVDLPASEYAGTCVFRCNTPDEALWHQLSPMAADPDGRMLERTCDLYLRLDW